MKKIPDRVDSKFRYVLLSAARAEQLIQRRPDANDESAKVTRVAMDEISSDAVEWDYGPPPEPEIAETEESEELAAESGDAES